MKIKRAGVGNIGEEELAQTKLKIQTREDTRRDAELLFPEGAVNRRRDVDLLKKLFVQTPGAETMSPQLRSKVAAVEEEYLTCSPLLTPYLDEFFKTAEAPQVTEAQKRYPELLKAGMAPGPTRPTPVSKSPAKATVTSKGGATPVQSAISGGSA